MRLAPIYQIGATYRNVKHALINISPRARADPVLELWLLRCPVSTSTVLSDINSLQHTNPTAYFNKTPTQRPYRFLQQLTATCSDSTLQKSRLELRIRQNFPIGRHWS